MLTNNIATPCTAQRADIRRDRQQKTMTTEGFYNERQTTQSHDDREVL